MFADHIVDTKIRFIIILNLNVCETFRGGSDCAASDSCVIYLSEREIERERERWAYIYRNT